MHYLIDGYNLLFQVIQPKSGEDFEATRSHFLRLLHSWATKLHLSLSIVFDAPKQNEILSRSHFGSLEIIFTAKGQSADDFLIEWLEEHAFVKNFTIVTSDRAVARKAKNLGTPVLSVKDFLTLLEKRQKKKSKPSSDTPKQPFSYKKDKKTDLPPLSDLPAWEKLFEQHLQNLS